MNTKPVTLLTLCLPLLLLGSCLEKKAHKETLVDTVWAFSLTHPEGFTLDIRTMTEPSEGIAVSYAATQGSHSKESLSFVIDHALEHDGYVGGWLDTDSGMYYFDSTKLYPEDRMEEAMEFGRDNGQYFMYVISTGERIRLNEPRKYASVQEVFTAASTILSPWTSCIVPTMRQ